MRLAPLFFLVCLVSQAADLAGTWQLNLVAFGDEIAPARLELRIAADKVTGSLNELKIEGTLKEGELSFRATRPNGTPFGTFEGRLKGAELTGTLAREDDRMGWIARRVELPSGPPQTRTFAPSRYHRYFSGTIPAALKINPGDTVRTTTVDAGGTDGHGVRRSAGGNPETGPFYVTGALPGDTLAVRLDRVRLNRDSAESGDRLTSSVLGAGYIRDAKYDDHFNSTWKLDRASGLAMLAKPTERLKNFRVKLAPMLGCVGVAPPDNQSFRSGWLGSWGGNMDYNRLREGTTVYLPVYQPGALLFVGDGHALQGDGELTGDALETSMEVEFTVNLIPRQEIGGPRAEDAESLMAMGVAGAVPEALRQATTSLARWIEHDYHLTPNETAVVLGTSIRYDIAELVDPQVNVVARISKAVLAGIPK